MDAGSSRWLLDFGGDGHAIVLRWVSGVCSAWREPGGTSDTMGDVERALGHFGCWIGCIEEEMGELDGGGRIRSAGCGVAMITVGRYACEYLRHSICEECRAMAINFGGLV